jgi:hypothetical protein
MSNEDFSTRPVTWCYTWMSFLIHNVLCSLTEEFSSMTTFDMFKESLQHLGFLDLS